MKDIYAIIIAAGLSSRMGGFKPLLDIGGKPALLRLLDTILSAGIGRVLVVTGHGRDMIEDALEGYGAAGVVAPEGYGDTTESHGGARGVAPEGYGVAGGVAPEDYGDTPESHGGAGVVAPEGYGDTPENQGDALESRGDARVVALYNEGYASGMFGSVQAGIRYVAGRRDCRAALLFPVDVPLVAAETVTGLVGAWEREAKPGSSGADAVSGEPAGAWERGESHGASGADAGSCELVGAWERGESLRFAIPVYEGKNGHPLLIPRGRFEEILLYTGDNGLKGVRVAYDADMVKYATNDAGCVMDMDTLEDYAKLVEYYGQRKDG